MGSETVPQSAFADFWRRVAAAVAGVDGIAFGLMNEPYDISAEDWLSAANSAIGRSARRESPISCSYRARPGQEPIDLPQMQVLSRVFSEQSTCYW
ncbi:hypothetical protein [Neorhizobium galegae]|uniref:hypothetical protein n=1 Tax=Neorhizobium galegae TaxID=399 RepID=UPI0035900FE1